MSIAVFFYSLYIFNMNTRELYKEVTSRVLKVYEIFQDYFGEDKVDLQGLRTEEQTVEKFGEGECQRSELISYLEDFNIYIYVHFPEVRVTNEYDRYVDIKNLWAKVQILIDGRLANRFTLNRSEYPIEHIISDYLHSHIPGINISNPSEFLTPCTGSGPINRTITSLCTEYDESLWLLFCCELGMFVTVESIQGTPYRRIEDIRALSYKISESPDRLTPQIVKSGFEHSHCELLSDFYRYFINKKCLKFVYCNDGYYLGISFSEFRIIISNCFIEWINRPDNPYRILYNYPYLLRSNILSKYRFINNKFYPVRYYNGARSVDGELLATFNGSRVLTFKGEEIRISISSTSDETSEIENFALLLNINICDIYLSLILRTINYEYRTNNSSEDSTVSYREVRYI